MGTVTWVILDGHLIPRVSHLPTDWKMRDPGNMVGLIVNEAHSFVKIKSFFFLKRFHHLPSAIIRILKCIIWEHNFDVSAADT